MKTNNNNTSARHLLAVGLLCISGVAFAGAQKEEVLSASVRASLQKSLADTAVTQTAFRNPVDARAWLGEMSKRLARFMPNASERIEFLSTLHWEASRAGIDPQLLLGLIQVESGFHKYAVSPVGARGYTQVMPFWVKLIGAPDQNLFQLRTNLRYGAVILRHYIDMEHGSYFRALGRYNGSLGQPEYPNMVVGAWKRQWSYQGVTTTAELSER
jgi:soluble lytic murein transglycosylase-like protein